jgi:vacuolar-type H+-ATPase subunit I/STV1
VTAQDQATLMLVWHGIEAMFDALLFTGLVILPLGLIALGAAMLGAPGYGKRMGRTTVALGVAGLAAATAVLVGVPSMAAVGVFALIGFHLTLGWKTHKLARAPHSRTLADA